MIIELADNYARHIVVAAGRRVSPRFGGGKRLRRSA
jgi:hypothetical protein